LIKKKL